MSETFDKDQYLGTDQASTHHRLNPSPERNTPEIEADFERLMQDGYVIINNLLDADTIAQIKSESAPLLNRTGRNVFEGRKTQRVYDVLSKTRAVDRLADHPRILGLMDRLFMPGFLLSQTQIINILPGESAQALHCDDSMYQLPRPRQPLGAATIWAIDEFTIENGATRVIPNSQHWGDERTPTEQEVEYAVMPAGSVVFFLGTLWHGGGANNSSKPRLAVTHQYCEAFMRQQENYILELSKDTVRGLSPELQALVGYSICAPFMGMVNGMHPLRALKEDD